MLLSVPGPSVIGEAMDALGAGRHVMIFSDNVPLEHELALKQTAAQRGLLVMGPDCGTAIVSGVGLGFANVLGAADEGPRVGIIAASGTGAQQVLSAGRGRREHLAPARGRRPRPVRVDRRGERDAGAEPCSTPTRPPTTS